MNNMDGENKAWYGMWVRSGSESKFVEALRMALLEKGLSHTLHDVFIPAVAEKERFAAAPGKKKRYFPVFSYYVFLCVDPSSQCLSIAESIPGFMSFVGSGRSRQVVIPDHEIRNMIEVGSNASVNKWQKSYVIGDKVKIIDGPFAALVATVEDVDEAKERLKLSVFIFGKSLVIDSGFDGVENV